MQQPHPKYRINYRFCSQPHHQSEKTNLVCLSSQCQSNPLICSFCQQHQHKGHKTKPLKHFLSSLEKHYSQRKDSTLDQELQQLQRGKNFWMTKIRYLVEKLADKFIKLQQQVIDKYEVIKSQIFEREAKRSRFNSFYQSMATQGKGDPNFQIQNYLHFDPLLVFEQPEQLIDGFIKTWTSNIQELRQKLTVLKKDNVFVENTGTKVVSALNLPQNKQFLMPFSIKRVGNNFIQTNPASKETLGHLDVLLKNWTGKIKVKIESLKPGSKFVVGVAKLTDIVTSKSMEQLKNKYGVFYFDSNGVAKQQEYNHITSLKTGDTVYLFVKKNNFKIMHQKNQVCCHHLKSKEDTVVYFSLQGQIQVQMIYPYYKVHN